MASRLNNAQTHLEPRELQKMTAKLTAKPIENHGKWETSVDKGNVKNGSRSRTKKAQ